MQLSIVVVLLAGDVAVRGGHAGAGAVLAAARPAAAGRSAQGHRRQALHDQRAGARRRWTTATGGCCTSRSTTARRWSAAGAASVVAAVLILPDAAVRSSRRRPTRARCRCSAELAAGHAHRSDRPGAAASRAARSRELVPEATDVDRQRRRRRRLRRPGRWRRRQVNRGNVQLPAEAEGRAEAVERSDRAWICGVSCAGIPGVIVRANASGGNNQMNRFLSGGNSGGGRLSLEIRGERSRRRAQAGAGAPKTCSTRCRASPTRGSAATKDVRSWRCASIARRRRSSA